MTNLLANAIKWEDWCPIRKVIMRTKEPLIVQLIKHFIELSIQWIE